MGAKKWCNSKDLAGQRFGRLIAVERTDRRVNCKVVWRCLCDCGNEKFKTSSDLTSGNTRSCGCLQKEFHITHGLTGTKVYKNYREAKRRSEKLQRTPAWSDLDRIREIYAGCPSGFHVDHIIPLNGEKVSGFHVPENLQYLPAAVNTQKSNKFEPQIQTSNQ